MLVGASGLKAWRVATAYTGRVPGSGRPTAAAGAGGTVLAAGAGAAFVSTLATARAIGIERRRPLWPWAAWRAGLAAVILAVRQNRGR